MKFIYSLTALACLQYFSIALVFAQSLQTLEARIKSMEACRQSLKHGDCNLQILDKDMRDLLIQMDQLNQRRQRQQPAISGKIGEQGSVQFFTATISEVNGEILKFMSGGTWRLDRDYFGLPLQDAVGVMVDQRSAIIYANDNSYGARLISGAPYTSTGVVKTVVEKMGGGSILKLNDGTMLEFSSYEKYDTGWWLPPYKVLIDLSGMNMWNLDKGKKVWIQRVL